jgi:hypothetical protein
MRSPTRTDESKSISKMFDFKILLHTRKAKLPKNVELLKKKIPAYQGIKLNKRISGKGH